MSSLLTPNRPSERIALCYIRMSWTREGDETQSPERQRANILRKCEEEGYTPLWFEDVDGHKSGRDVKNRPGWQALVAQIGNPNVAAVIANDLSRLHRKGWRIGKLLDTLEQRRIALITAAPGKEINTNSAMGKFIINITATFDEQYADDIADKVKDGIRYRKSRGKSVGRPPFGTVRDVNGYLQPSNEGAWWLLEGSYLKGSSAICPAEGAVWRTYYQTAEYILRLYAEGEIGAEKLSYLMNSEGYPFRDRKGNPRMVLRDDIRRVLANWPEYGGLVLGQTAKTRTVFTNDEVESIQLDPDRTVFPVDLLQKVAKIRSGRALRPVDRGHKRTSYPYPMSYITRCAHCEALAIIEGDPTRRTNLNGTYLNGIRRYRHKPGASCSCATRSVLCDQLEEDFARLIKGLTVNQEALAMMAELAADAERNATGDDAFVDPNVERQRSIERIKKKIRNTKTLFMEGHIEEAEFRQRLADSEREQAQWEAYTTQREQALLELTQCLNAIEQVAQVWDIAEPKERQIMARNLFDHIVYDLDKQRIIDFRLKPWADRFLVLRAALYEEGSAIETQNASTYEQKRNVPHTGVQTPLRLHLVMAACQLLETIFPGVPRRRTCPNPAKVTRNEFIRQRYAAGELMSDLSKEFGISSQRISQIVHDQRR